MVIEMHIARQSAGIFTDPPTPFPTTQLRNRFVVLIDFGKLQKVVAAEALNKQLITSTARRRRIDARRINGCALASRKKLFLSFIAECDINA